MNMGTLFGVGFQHKWIHIGANYNFGLFDITKNELSLHKSYMEYVCDCAYMETKNLISAFCEHISHNFFVLFV